MKSTPKPRPYQRHGLHALARRLEVDGVPEAEWRDAIVRDLDGADALSTQQVALVDVLVRTKLLLDSVDAHVLGMPSPVNRQRRHFVFRSYLPRPSVIPCAGSNPTRQRHQRSGFRSRHR